MRLQAGAETGTPMPLSNLPVLKQCCGTGPSRDQVPLPKTKLVFPVSVLIKSAQSACAYTGTVNGEGKRVWTSRRNMRCPSARFRWPFCLKRTQTSPRSGRMREARTGLSKPRSRAGQSGLAPAKGLSTHFGPCGPPKYRRRALHRTDPSKSNSRRRCPDRCPRLRPRFAEDRATIAPPQNLDRSLSTERAA